ncbi:YceI family protein [Candidatus Oscillochloris fontis]|uniref:YceI family protein n=1 Tax=Candidatus Oscillochloris fontis TaxID=2496868 RepID=UPI00101BE400|nr:YceI family protein [Candidatus Oscillochloris fontis]
MSWTIDTAHSQVAFSVRHLMIARTRGRFNQFQGTVNFDEQNPANSSVDVTIDTASINTMNDQRDTHLKSNDFLDVATFPTMTFVSKRIEVLSSNRGKIIGDLTIRGVTREIVLPTEYNGQSKSPWGATSAGFSAEIRINRKDWGLEWNVALETGGILVGDDIDISIDIEIIKNEG